ncbi:MAG: SBBP repeat-containing protein [Caldilineaceae bacterium]
MVVAPNGALYIAGQVSDDAGFADVLVMALDRQSHTMRNAIRFGNERGEDIGNAIAVDQDGNLYVTGKTEPQGQDTDSPLVNPFRPTVALAILLVIVAMMPLSPSSIRPWKICSIAPTLEGAIMAARSVRVTMLALVLLWVPMARSM